MKARLAGRGQIVADADLFIAAIALSLRFGAAVRASGLLG